VNEARGYIKLHRELMEKAIWTGATPQQKVVLIRILTKANYLENEWEWKGRKYKVQPGQFVTSLRSLAKECGTGISVQNVRSAILRFEKYDFLTHESTQDPTHGGTLITIANWALYQISDSNPTQQATQDPTECQHILKKDKKIKNINMCDFDRFWKAYPLKNSKAAALKSFSKIAPDPKLFDQMMAAVETQKSTKIRLKESGQFCPAWPNPATWLNNKRWEDEATDDQEQDSQPGQLYMEVT